MSDPLLPRIALGDSEAVQQCLDRYEALVWSLARSFFRDSSEAEDAVQEIFIELWKNAHRFDSKKAAESTFVTMIARRRLIDRARKHQRRPEPASLIEETVSSDRSAAETAIVNDEARRAAQVLEVLRPEQRQVLELAIYRGWTHEQIAADLTIPLGSVKTHARRGLLRLRELLKANESGRPEEGLA